MTEEIAATPGWVDERIASIFGRLGGSPELEAAKEAYATCLAQRKQPAEPSDLLGANYRLCRTALQRSLRTLPAGGSPIEWASLDRDLDALEAEIASGS